MKNAEIISQKEIAEVRQSLEQCMSEGSFATVGNKTYLVRCIEAGEKLMQLQRKLDHGKWQKFFDDNFNNLGVDIRTAQRWIKVARMHSNGKLNLEEVKGIRSAYVQIGLIPEEATHSAASEDNTCKPLLFSLLSRITALIAKLDLASINHEYRLAALALIKPVIDFNHALLASLDDALPVKKSPSPPPHP